MATFLEEKRRSPIGLTIVIAGHVAALGALLLAKQQIEPKIFTIPKARNIAIEPPPPPVPQPEPAQVPVEPQALTVREPLVALPPLPRPNVDAEPIPALPRIDALPDPVAADPPAAIDLPPAPPVRVAARIDGRSALQPPYPASEQRAGREGSVTVRVTIDASGRVRAVEKVSATSDAFWLATERQALRAWRFRPATLDGRPVESEQTLTVRFRIDARAV